ncbi:MAG: hypothetical protein MR210_03225 [Erysipelotrichaceae bacterium]|nr:hypothetical protein [Erysipelotrichaceae bacterium]MDY5252422.1 hypothetical protein [Erysipelotrichaceae bacterium]
MAKNIFKILFKTLLVIVIVIGAWVALTPVFRYDESNEGNQFRNVPKDILDIIVLGSSHAQYSMNPAVIYTESGYYSYVLGSGCQPMSMSYHFLVEALKTQSPEVVLLDVFTMMPSRSVCYADGMYYKAAQQMTGLNRIKAGLEVENDEKKLEYAFDLLMNHGKWKQDDFLVNPDDSEYNEMLGYVAQQPVERKFNHLIPFERGNTEIIFRENDLEALDKIIALCEKNNIKLILFKAAIDIDQENYDHLQAIWDLADEKGIEHVDFLALAEEIGFTLGMDGDTWHNNTWGAQKCSKYMAHYLQDKGYVTKHQENDAYAKLLNELSAITSAALFDQNVDVYQLLDYASKYDMTIVVKYTGATNTTIGDYENQLLQAAGINFDFLANKTQNYHAVIVNKEVIASSDQPISTNANGTDIQVTQDKITIGTQTFENLGELEIIFCGNDFSWYNEMPINYASRFFWKNGCDGWNCEG